MSENWDRAYKVVRIGSDGKLYSYFAFAHACLEYKKGEVTRPKFGKLFVFDSLENAGTHQVGVTQENQVWEVECLDLEPAEEMCSPGDWEEYWEKWWKSDDRRESDFPFFGTMFASAVRLVREITWQKDG